MDLFSTLQLLHEAVMSVLVTTIHGRWRGTITLRTSLRYDSVSLVKFGWLQIIPGTRIAVPLLVFVGKLSDLLPEYPRLMPPKLRMCTKGCG